MDTENAMEYIKVEEMVATSGCDYCDKPEGRRFIKFHQWEWANSTTVGDLPFGGNVRSVKTEDDWGSKYDDNDEESLIIEGIQTKVHYHCCEKCLIKYADHLYNTVSKYVGNPHQWYQQHVNEQIEIARRYEELKIQRVGVSITKEATW